VTLVEVAVGSGSGGSVGVLVVAGSSGGVAVASAVASAVAGRVGSGSIVASDVAVGVGRDDRLVFVAAAVAWLSVSEGSSAWQAARIAKSTNEPMSNSIASRCRSMRSLST
jgi:hypothetical protein